MNIKMKENSYNNKTFQMNFSIKGKLFNGVRFSTTHKKKTFIDKRKIKRGSKLVSPTYVISFDRQKKNRGSKNYVRGNKGTLLSH